MNDITVTDVYIILAALAGLAVSVLFIRWVFGINKALARQRAIVHLLTAIARQSGVPDETINKINNELPETDRYEH